MAFGEALTEDFRDYSRQVVDNAQVLAEALVERGFAIVSGGTDTHLMLVDLRPKGLTGKEAEKLLGKADITVNKNTIPDDPQSPFVTSGIRLGTPALTTRGMGTAEMRRIAELIDEALTAARRRHAGARRRRGARDDQVVPAVPAGGQPPPRAADGVIRATTMTELQFADDILARIRAKGGAFDERGYLFVLASIEFVQSRLTVRRHISGPELAWACRDLARERFGLLARPVLAHWGLTRTEDFGRIVYTLVEIGLLVTLPGDSEEDFRDVFEFESAFDESYAWEGVTPRRCLTRRNVGGRHGRIGGTHGHARLARVPQVQRRKADPPLRLRPRRRADHLQSLGLHQPRLRIQPPHRQRGNFVWPRHRAEPQVRTA